MKMRILVLFATILFIVSLSACNDKNKYDHEINQVIELEKDYLQNEIKIKSTEKIKRSDIVIAVYKKGKYINLIYEVNNTIKIDCFYKKTKKSKYIRYSNSDKEIEKVEKDLRNADYIENTYNK
ncbi:hypothetical protein [Gottfriedia acidiceleris]|uniref:DUF4467 domain-containing protein n=1 Tax=Gottfriedia acidiceleris TaxID=371036 RepID=A0ABY4JNM3_9BACI|nr:hypothetical protein [Gottfriedia acidiceleris]UPM55441.1 hypothetical protein MY490_06255 [Gottfriedia acidiceleris]